MATEQQEVGVSRSRGLNKLREKGQSQMVPNQFAEESRQILEKDTCRGTSSLLTTLSQNCFDSSLYPLPFLKGAFMG